VNATSTIPADERAVVLLAINNAIVNCRSAQELIQAIKEVLAGVLPFLRFGMTFCDPGNGQFRFVALVGNPAHSDFSVGNLKQPLRHC